MYTTRLHAFLVLMRIPEMSDHHTPNGSLLASVHLHQIELQLAIRSNGRGRGEVGAGRTEASSGLAGTCTAMFWGRRRMKGRAVVEARAACTPITAATCFRAAPCGRATAPVSQ